MARTVIENGTVLSMDPDVGDHERADVITISTDDVNTMPAHDPVETVVFQSNPSNVEHVLVDGEVRKRDGELVDPTYRDLEDEFNAAATRLLREAGVEP